MNKDDKTLYLWLVFDHGQENWVLIFVIAMEERYGLDILFKEIKPCSYIIITFV